MTSPSKDGNLAGTQATISLPGLVQKIFRAIEPGKPDKIQILVKDAEDLYREIRVDNLFQDGDGNFVNLKIGDEIEITITCGPQAHADKPIRDLGFVE